MSARQRAGIGMVALALVAGTLTGCGSKSATTTPVAIPPTTATTPTATSEPTVITPGTRTSAAATQSALDPFASSGPGGGSTGAGSPGSATTVPASASGGGSSATTAPSTASPTTAAPTSGTPTTASPVTSSPTTESPTTAPSSTPTTSPPGTSATTAPAATTTTVPAANSYGAWAVAHGQPDFDRLSQSLALITRAIALRDRGRGSAQMHTDGARLVRQAVGMESQAGPPIASLTNPWHVVLHSYVAYGRSVRSRRSWSTLVADLREISAALAKYDRAADAAGVGPDS